MYGLTAAQVNTAKWIADLMAADGITAEQAMNDDLILAYMEEVGRRIEKIQTTYLTNQEAAKALQNHVFITI